MRNQANKNNNGLLAHMIAQSGKKPFITLTTRKEEKKQEVTRPWVGSYFGIPEPEKVETGKPTSYTTAEAEIHILLKNMEVEVFTIKENWPHHSINKDGVPYLGMVDEQDLSMPLREKAWKRDDAIAFVIYYSYTDSRTGVKRQSRDISRWMKAERYKWQWVSDHGERGKPFVPDVVKMRHPHVFS